MPKPGKLRAMIGLRFGSPLQLAELGEQPDKASMPQLFAHSYVSSSRKSQIQQMRQALSHLCIEGSATTIAPNDPEKHSAFSSAQSEPAQRETDQEGAKNTNHTGNGRPPMQCR